LINNRQNGRRRGRGGGQRSPNNIPSNGNRQDNRQRGNAAQLHEKYKALARDAQLSGDRVQTEYYLQFADHYFRVLNEGRARFEEQRRQRDDFGGGDDDDQDEAASAADGDDRDDRDEREEREPRFARDNHRNGTERGRDNGERNRDNAERGRDNGRDRPRRQAAAVSDEADDGDEERISLDVLPPAIAAEESEPVRAPRRRTRRPRPDEDSEIAPAA
jgi:hypothetical protein